MPSVLTRADCLREYITGASSAGGVSSGPSFSLGNHRSSTPVTFLGIAIDNAITGVTIDFASGANLEGVGTLSAPTTSTLTWTPPGGSAGTPVSFSGTQQKIVEGLNSPGQYVRVTGTPPFSGGPSLVTLSDLYDGFFGLDDLTPTQASAGLTQYRASMVRNEAATDVLSFQRYIGTLGTPAASNVSWLSGGGSGTVSTSASFADWPDDGWAQVRDSGGTLKEVIYYSSRSSTALTVPATGRALLGTSATAGTNSDVLTPVPGIAIGTDPLGVVSATTPIQTVASQTTAPTGVTWNLGLTALTGLQIGTVPTGQQVGVWVKRHIPAGKQATPKMLNRVLNSFIAF